VYYHEIAEAHGTRERSLIMAVEPEYPIVLRPLAAEDGGGWIALVPDLPGCMSDGESADEALRNVRDAIEEWKDAALSLGRPVPRPGDWSLR
jgi:antitoxin HicB